MITLDDCRRYREQLSLPGSEGLMEPALLSHARRCSHCQALARDYTTAVGELGAMHECAPAEPEVAAFVERARFRAVVPTPQARSRWLLAASLAALLAGGALVAWLARPPMESPSRGKGPGAALAGPGGPPGATGTMADVQATSSQTLPLPAGGKIVLAAGAHLKSVERSEAGASLHLVSGEITVWVSPGGMPEGLEIRTGAAVLRTSGGAVAVRHGPAGTRVTCQMGSASVRSRLTGEAQLLSPGATTMVSGSP